MNYFVYNHRLLKESEDNVLLIYRCEHCHSNIIGSWSFIDKFLTYYDGNGESIVCFLSDLFEDKIYSVNEFKKLLSYEEYDPFKKTVVKEKDEKAFKEGKKYIESKNYQNAIKYKEEIFDFINMDVCPACGNKLSQSKPYYFGSFWISVFPDKIKEMVDDVYSCSKTYKNKELEFFSKTKFQKGDIVITKDGTGRIFSIEDEYYIVDFFDPDSISSVLDFLKRNDDTKHRLIAKEKVKNVVNKNANTIVKKEKPLLKDSFDLKEYLLNLLTVEKEIFSISERLEELYVLECSIYTEVIGSEFSIMHDARKSSEELKQRYESLLKEKPWEVFELKQFEIKPPKKPIEPTKPIEPILQKPNLFNRKKVLLQNAQLTEKYEKEILNYERAYKRYKLKLSEYFSTVEKLKEDQNKNYTEAVEKSKKQHREECEEIKKAYEMAICKCEQIRENSNDIALPQKVKQAFVKEEITQAEDLLKGLCKARNELFSYNIIFEKYRNFVAVATFYEYISSGRCEILEGHDGAYNLYENEIRMNTVISQLTEVIESLEEIKQSQYMIYSGIQESNAELSCLNSKMENAVKTLCEIKSDNDDMKSYMSKIEKNTEVIAYNTERIAFYAKKNTELTNALGYMVALS